MELRPLRCGGCGAPLEPSPSALIQCPYCKVVHQAGAVTAGTTRPAAVAPGWTGLADYRRRGVFHPATCVEVGGDGRAAMVYADSGVLERLPFEALALDTLTPGTRVTTTAFGESHDGVVTRRIGHALEVQLDGRSSVWTSAGSVHVAASALSATNAVARAPAAGSAELGAPVLAPWIDGAPWFYPGTLVERSGGRTFVVYHDGLQKEWPDEAVHLTEIQAGWAVQTQRRLDDWRSGVVETIGGHACLVRYGDGERAWTALRRLRTARPELCALASGWRGLVDFLEKGIYYPATIMDAHYDGTFTVAYADGMNERVRPSALVPDTLVPGARVRVSGGPGTVRNRVGDAFLVALDEGRDAWTSIGQVGVARAELASNVAPAPRPPSQGRGSVALVRWSDTTMAFPATIVDQRADGVMFVVYADGMSEQRAPADLRGTLSVDMPVFVRRLDAPSERGLVRRVEGFALEIEVNGATELTATSRVSAA